MNTNKTRMMRAVATGFAAAMLTLTSLATPAMADINDNWTTKHPYPEYGQKLDAASLSKAITAHAGTSIVKPGSTVTEGMGSATAPNVGTTNPNSFKETTGTAAWFGEPFSVKVPGTNCTAYDIVLKRDLVDVKLADDGCTVLSGTLYSPFSARDEATPNEGIEFDASKAKPEESDTDVRQVMVVPIVGREWAYAHGAYAMDPDTRLMMMNDPLNLIAVPTPTMAVGSTTPTIGSGLFSDPSISGGYVYNPDERPGGWLPPNKAAQKPYAARFATVMMRYGLTMNAKDAAKFTELMNGWDGTLDTTSAGLNAIASSRTADMVPGTVPAETSAAPSAEPSKNLPTHPSQKDGSSQSATSTVVIVGGVAALLLVAAGGAYIAYSRRKKNS